MWSLMCELSNIPLNKVHKSETIHLCGFHVLSIFDRPFSSEHARFAVHIGQLGAGQSLGAPTQRWSTTLSPKVYLYRAINFRALSGANLVTQHPKFRPSWSRPEEHQRLTRVRDVDRFPVAVLRAHIRRLNGRSHLVPRT